LPDVIKKGVAISILYKIFGRSSEMLKAMMAWKNEKGIGKTTVDFWRLQPRRRILDTQIRTSPIKTYLRQPLRNGIPSFKAVGLGFS